MTVPALAVDLREITQRFGAVVALDQVDLQVRPGAIHALVGENGAGKTTLMRVLQGHLPGHDGTVALRGEVVRLTRPEDALRLRVGMVSQHYSIIPDLTCLQNLILGDERSAWLRPKDAAERAEALARRMGFHFEWSAEARTLSPAGAQKLEILKLLWRESEIMILDEPTAMLSPSDADALFESLHQLTAQGATVILVTHRIPEVLDHCAHVTVLRGGKRVADFPVAETDAAGLAEAIVGHALGPPPALSSRVGDPILTVEQLTVRGYRGDDAVQNASLEVRAGELVGVAGVDGSGQRELVQAITGVRRARSGRLRLSGDDVTSTSPAHRIRKGVRLIPEDRLAEGVVEDWSLIDNSALGLQRLSPLAQGPWFHRAEAASLAERVVARFRTKHGSLKHPMRSLSGGNQQRLVAARALAVDPRLVVAFQPARGLDIDGAAQVYQALRDAAQAGAGALVVSFDLDELLTFCDRVVVMRHGQVFTPPEDARRDRAVIGRLMVGADATGGPA